MAELKTQPTPVSVSDFIAKVEPAQRREDAQTLCDLLSRVSGEDPVMWGPSIIGYGSYSYRYDSGREGTMCRIGFSPRKAQLVLYLLTGRAGEAAQLERLGPHKKGASCLYIKELADIDMAVLETLARDAWTEMNAKYPLN